MYTPTLKSLQSQFSKNRKASRIKYLDQKIMFLKEHVNSCFLRRKFEFFREKCKENISLLRKKISERNEVMKSHPSQVKSTYDAMMDEKNSQKI